MTTFELAQCNSLENRPRVSIDLGLPLYHTLRKTIQIATISSLPLLGLLAIGYSCLQSRQLVPSNMFFLHRLERTITLHPSFFGPRIKEYLTNKLLQDVEGTCTGSFYIICCLDSFEFSEGRVVPGSAVAEYTVSYRAVVWRPFRGETVRLVVDLQ